LINRQKYISLEEKAAVEQLVNDPKHRFVYEDYFNPAFFDISKRKASF
jgi:hypothetical protein